jgi:phenylpropionate dioxygenase-like ring-hydroxylating dioxygenase large terminal subunit
MGRFPFGIPNSWFLVGYTQDLPAGAVKPISYLERDLVLFRGDDGVARVFDAFCPHLGAHLGYGGKVVGNTIQCPFHAWRFDGSGRCVEVPYAKKIPAKAQVRAYEVHEHSGMIFVWQHDQEKPADFRIPVIEEYGDREWTHPWIQYNWTVKTHPQEIMENAIDWPHFESVHLMAVPSARGEKFDGPMFFWNIGTQKTVQTMGQPDTLYMEAQNWGLGFNFLHYTGMFKTIIASGLTPIDAETTHIQFAIIGKKEGRTEEETRALLKAYMHDQALAIQQDFEIWSHKQFRPRPTLCDGDGPIGEFRKWARQFYSKDWYAKASAAER